jgi:dipeptidyl aminopeptidase/acylaminoacyl peptidase
MSPAVVRRRARPALVCAGVAAAWALLAQTPPPGFTPADVHALKSVGDVQISPDASRVAYVVLSNERSGRSSTGLWVYSRASGTHVQAGDGRDRVSTPRWSPDNRWIAYLGRPDGRPGLVLVRVDDDLVSDPEFVIPVTTTNHPLPHTGEPFAWSPGSSRLAYVTAMPGPEPDEGNGDPVVISRYAYKPPTAEGPGRLNDNRRLQVFMVDLVTRRPQALTDAPFHHHSIDWSRTGDEILLASNQGADPDRVFNDDLFAVSIAKRTVRRVTDTPGVEYDPVWSPDGTLIAARASVRPRTSSETTMEDTHVWVMKPDGTARREVAAALDNRHSAPKWSADGRWVYFTVQERGDLRLYRAAVAPAGKSGAAASAAPLEPIAPAPSEHGVVGAWSLARDGTVAFALTTADRPAEVYVRTAGADSPTRITSLNDALLSARRIAATERFTFAGDDGLQVEAFLTRPLTIDAAARHPMIVSIHGGPHGQQGPAFALKPQVYAAKGWATLMVNYRGSTGYGQAFADAIARDQNGAEARDVLAGVDAALARLPWLDPSRLGVEGGSYGGQLTNWIVTQTPRFKAAVSTAGIANLVSFNYTAYYHDYLAVEFGAYPHEGDLMDLLFQRSPIRHVAKVRTPVLLIHGENDHDVPIAEAEQFFIALKDAGVDTVMVRYPREGHGLREARHQADALTRAIGWYERYLK